MSTDTLSMRELCSTMSKKAECSTLVEEGSQPIASENTEVQADEPEVRDSSEILGEGEAQRTVPEVLALEIRAERLAHDTALLAKLTAFPRRNKINFAFGKFLLAQKFYSLETRAEVESQALKCLFATTLAIASRFNWKHAEGKCGWKSLAWDTASHKAAKYVHLTEEEIFEHIQNKKFWAWRWLYEAMITLFRELGRDRSSLVRYYFAVRPDKRRRGHPVEDEDDLTPLYERSTDTGSLDGDSAATDEGFATADIQGFDQINPVPDPRQTPDELRFDTNPEGEYESQESDDSLPDGNILGPQRLSREQKRAILSQVDPDLLVFLDRLAQDEDSSKSLLGKGLADFDQKKLHRLSTLILRRYAQSCGLSQRTGERRIEKIRKLAGTDKHFLSRFGEPRR